MSDTTDQGGLLLASCICAFISAFLTSLQFVPGPFLRAANGAPLSLFTSAGLLVGSIVIWAFGGFQNPDEEHFFRPGAMIGGVAFALSMISGFLAIRLIGIAGTQLMTAGMIILSFAFMRRFGLPGLPAFGLDKIPADINRTPDLLEALGMILVICGAFIGLFIPVRNIMSSNIPYRAAKTERMRARKLEERRRRQEEKGIPAGYDHLYTMFDGDGDMRYEDVMDSESGSTSDGKDGNLSGELGGMRFGDSELISLITRREASAEQTRSRDSVADSAVVRWTTDLSRVRRRAVGIACALVSAFFASAQFLPLFHPDDDPSSEEDSFDMDIRATKSNSWYDAVQEIGLGDVFAFACGAFPTSVVAVIINGAITKNKMSFPRKGTLLCVLCGFLYAVGMGLWLLARHNLTDSIADSVTWGLVPAFTSLWGFLFGEQYGAMCHIMVGSGVVLIAMGSIALSFTQLL